MCLRRCNEPPEHETIVEGINFKKLSKAELLTVKTLRVFTIVPPHPACPKCKILAIQGNCSIEASCPPIINCEGILRRCKTKQQAQQKNFQLHCAISLDRMVLQLKFYRVSNQVLGLRLRLLLYQLLSTLSGIKGFSYRRNLSISAETNLTRSSNLPHF